MRTFLRQPATMTGMSEPGGPKSAYEEVRCGVVEDCRYHNCRCGVVDDWRDKVCRGGLERSGVPWMTGEIRCAVVNWRDQVCRGGLEESGVPIRCAVVDLRNQVFRSGVKRSGVSWRTENIWCVVEYWKDLVCRGGLESGEIRYVVEDWRDQVCRGEMERSGVPLWTGAIRCAVVY